MIEAITSLLTLILVITGMLLRAVALVAIAMLVLWLVGHLFPYVADSLGIPYTTVYQAVAALVETIWSLVTIQ